MGDRPDPSAELEDRLARLTRLGDELLGELRLLAAKLERIRELGDDASALITPELIVGESTPEDAP